MFLLASKKVAVETKATLLDAYSNVIEEARQEFEAEKAEQSAAWKKELARIKEEDNYQFGIAKRDREEALKAELANRVIAVAAREDKVDLREEAVGNAETKISELQSKVDSIPAIAAKAEAAGVNKGSIEAKKDFDAEVRLIKAENDADKRISDNKIATLEGTVVSLELQVKSLREELVAANARVQEIANSAVTAAGQSQVTVNTAQGK